MFQQHSLKYKRSDRDPFLRRGPHSDYINILYKENKQVICLLIRGYHLYQFALRKT